MERELSAALLPVAGQALRAGSASLDKLKTERYLHEQGTRDADVRSDRAALAWGSDPQATLGQPRMGAHIPLLFGARLSLHQFYILSERHRLSIQTFDRDRLDELPWLPDLEVLLSGVHPTGDPAFQRGFGSRSSPGS
jgi:hypothetical protein